MFALVVFETGDEPTCSIASAVTAALRDGALVGMVGLAQAPTRIGTGVNLLVLGLTGCGSRRPVAGGLGQPTGARLGRASNVSDWIERLHPASPEFAVACFETTPLPAAPDSAESMIRRFRGLGLRIAAPAETFRVVRAGGRLEPGELARAQRWA